MKTINEVIEKQKRPIKVIQFGEGVFLRGFFDWMLQILNNKGVFNGSAVVVKPIEPMGRMKEFAAQDYLYTNLIRDLNGEDTQVVDVIDHMVCPYAEFDKFLELAALPEARFIVSNTTEAGIAFDETDTFEQTPPSTYPAKLTKLLYQRFTLGLPGFWIIPCELIEKNGVALRKYVFRYAELWNLGEDFIAWLENENKFCSTLVDRIVSGFPADAELPYEDTFRNSAESFHFWAIEGKGLFEELPFDKAGCNVLLTDDITPYRERKVRILNGAHTSMVCLGLLSGMETVEDCMKNEEIFSFVSDFIQNEAIKTLDLPKEECEEFWNAVQKRFLNPYLHHKLSSISLNSVSKYCARVLPTVLDLEKQGIVAKNGLKACEYLIKWYKTGTPCDDEKVIQKIKDGTLEEILADASLWGDDYSRFAKEMSL